MSNPRVSENTFIKFYKAFVFKSLKSEIEAN